MNVHLSVYVYLCVCLTERDVAAAGAGGGGLWETSDPAGRLRGRSGCVDSFLRQMREQKWICLSSAVCVGVSEDGTTHHIASGFSVINTFQGVC